MEKCDRGLVFDPVNCQTRHYHAKNLEKRGRRNSFEYCGYCPKIIEFLQQERGEYDMRKEKEKMETKKVKEFCKRCGTGAFLNAHGLCAMCEKETVDEQQPKKQTVTIIKKPAAANSGGCVECGSTKKIAARGLCWKCYETPEIKRKYPPQPGKVRVKKKPPVDIPGVGTCPEPKSMQESGVNEHAPQPPVDLPPVSITPKKAAISDEQRKQMRLDAGIYECEFCGKDSEPGATLEFNGKVVCPVCYKQLTKEALSRNSIVQPVVGHNAKIYWQQIGPSIVAFIAQKKNEVEELKRQAREQEKLLNLKYFEISTLERFLQDFEQAIKGA